MSARSHEPRRRWAADGVSGWQQAGWGEETGGFVGRGKGNGQAAPAASVGGEPDFALLLRRVHQRHSAILAERLRSYGLTPAQATVLIRLRALGRLSQNHLGRLTAMDPATVQGVIRRLMARGLVGRDADPVDRRRIVLALTPAGRELAAQVDRQADDALADMLAPLAAAEIAQLTGLLARIA